MVSDEPPPCDGRSWLFDSTFLPDHLVAAEDCATCPLIDTCRERVRNERQRVPVGTPEGTWAGERWANGRLVKTRPPRPRGRPLAPCGTAAAYRRHIKDRTVPCAPCVLANRTKEGSA